jgi:2-keto-4-pentenoate hydratase/2-oxohepta-3-ene-1,7-dioic acid hydratase in catechol pathway
MSEHLHLASFRVGGRASYGIVGEAGVTDLGRRLEATYPTLIDIIRAGARGLAAARSAGDRLDLAHEDIEYVPPVPGTEKIICVGINYPERADEYKDGREKPKYPNLFVRFPGSFVGHDVPIVRPRHSKMFDYEGEIVIVIGRSGRDVPREDALGIVFGLTLGNEGSLRDWIRHGTLNVTQGKNFDRSGSIGPWIVPADEVPPFQPLHLTTRVNGELRQDDTTDRLTWDFAELIRYITMFATLNPGDLIFTGTPVGAGGHHKPPKWLVPGDVVEVEVPEIGTLRNAVIDEAMI